MSVTVKAFLKKTGPGPSDYEEIRRFAVGLGLDALVDSFQLLQRKIKTVFPSLANKTIQLYYRDYDNDLIAFSSDEEMSEALLTKTDGLFKVYIETKDGDIPKENSGNSGGVLHPHITCDGCEGQVRGTRYKCTVCPDYDLCQACKGQGLHPEHQMDAIEYPVFTRSFFHSSCGGAPSAGPPPCFFPSPGCPMMPPYFHGNQGNRDEMRMQRRAWRRWVRSMSGTDPCKAWKKDKKEDKHEKKARKAEKKARKEKEGAEKTEQTGAPKADGKDSSSSSSSSDDGEGSPTGDYLHCVGQSVSATLDPLGINAKIDVEHRGKRKHCHRGFHGDPWGFHMRGGRGGHGWGRGSGHGWGHGGRGGFWHMGGPFGGYGFSQSAAHACASQGAPPRSQDPHAQYPHAPPHYPHGVDANSETGELRSGSQKASWMPEPNGWTMVIDGDEADVDDAARRVERMKMTGQEAGSGSDQQGPSAEQRLIEALDTLMTMGYNDADGWLTTLLVDNNYDIGRTLDAIMNKK